ncbi:HAD family hydrolase [Streptomyces fragilis]|uniref:HAD family hydrolase n=1 Tax=Streptomyces fragilis TaxID=67301 RepID=UPI001FE93182|nr:HAD-IA family hydrolase [Streptomyces fragilis]
MWTERTARWHRCWGDGSWREPCWPVSGCWNGPTRPPRRRSPGWSAVLPAIDGEVVALLRQAREVASVALVTNATTRLERDLERQGLDGLADVVVNTARIGVAKPDPRVVRHAAERLGVPVGRCLFVDDTEADVPAAQEIGMTALHHRRVDDLRTAPAPLLRHGGAR